MTRSTATWVEGNTGQNGTAQSDVDKKRHRSGRIELEPRFEFRPQIIDAESFHCEQHQQVVDEVG